MEVTLPQRTRDILLSIVQEYIHTGEPVASRSIARRRKDNLSPATIRNIMADLADMGYLAQPHTSAGRVPTGKAFAAFARSLVAGRGLSIELESLRREILGLGTMEQRVERSSHLLSELTRNLGIVAAIPGSSQQLDQIELVLLADQRVLMVVVTQDRMVRNQVVRLEEPVTGDELVSIRNYVNRNFQGWALSEVRRELARRLALESATYDTLLKKLVLLYEKGLLDIEMTPQVYMEGASHLVGLDLHLTKEKLRELFRALEEKKRILHLLDQFLEIGKGEVRVQIGLSEAHPSMGELSLIGISLELPGGMDARVAVLGPMRMNYPRIMATVFQIGEALRTAPQ